MPINFGSTAISTIKIGTTQVDKIYLGTDLVWQNASISASPNPATDSQFRSEPAPSSLAMSAGTTLTGSGLTSATWVRLSGDSTISVTPGANGLSATFSASVLKNQDKTAVFRATGNHGLTVDVTVTLSYTTDL